MTDSARANQRTAQADPWKDAKYVRVPIGDIQDFLDAYNLESVKLEWKPWQKEPVLYVQSKSQTAAPVAALTNKEP